VLLGDEARGRLSPARRRSAGLPPGVASEPVLEELSAPAGPDWRTHPWRVGALVVVGVLFAGVVGSLRRYTLPTTVAVGVPAAIVLVWAWRASPRGRVDRPLGALGASAWIVVFVGFGLWELAALVSQPALLVDDPRHPTVSVLLDPLFAHHLGRSVGLGLWLAVGWFLVERLR
jgi:hypothetical protein